MKKIVSMVLVITILLGFATTSFGEVTIIGKDGKARNFTDVNGYDWYYAHVEELVEEGIIDGYNDNTFKPSKNVRVDEFIKTMVVALGHNPGNGASYWASEYIAKAKELGIISEADFSDYTVAITRAEMAMVAEKTLVALEGSQSYVVTDDVKEAIVDYKTAVQGSKYEINILHVYELGIITGYPDGTFGPNNQLTRAEFATIVRRVIDFSVRKPFTTSDIVRLARYEHDTSGLYEPPKDFGDDAQDFVDLALEYVDVRYNVDFTTLDYNTFRTDLEWFYSPSSRWTMGDTTYTADEWLDKTYWGIINSQVVRECYALSDASLPYINSSGRIVVPITVYFVARHTTSSSFTGTIDKWEKFDCEIWFANSSVKTEMRDMWEYGEYKYIYLKMLSDENMEVK